MKIIKSVCLFAAILATPSLYAQTDSQTKTQPYGDNPNIFRVLAHKTGEAVQNTAEKVGAGVESGIQKIKPSFDSTVENTKSYTTEQATIARDNTRQGIDTAVKKVEQTKDKVFGKTSANVPIEQGSLSQSSSASNSSVSNSVPYTAPIVQNAPIRSQSVQQIPLDQGSNQSAQNQTQNNVQDEPEIKKQSLPIENNLAPNNPSSNNPNTPNVTSTKDSSNDDSGVPR